MSSDVPPVPEPPATPAAAGDSSSAADLTVNVWDATGNKRQEVQMPADAPLRQILAVLVERLHFPRHGPDGQLLSYKVHHRESGRQLLEAQSLAEAGVGDGDVLRLMPEITAGGREG